MKFKDLCLWVTVLKSKSCYRPSGSVAACEMASQSWDRSATGLPGPAAGDGSLWGQGFRMCASRIGASVHVARMCMMAHVPKSRSGFDVACVGRSHPAVHAHVLPVVRARVAVERELHLIVPEAGGDRLQAAALTLVSIIYLSRVYCTHEASSWAMLLARMLCDTGDAGNQEVHA